MKLAHPARVFPAMLLLMLGMTATTQGALPKVPEGFEVRLVATVPAVLYPCQVGTGPDGALFVAEDPMDQVGPYESKNGRILLFRDGKDPVLYAEGFRAIQGMAWHDGSLYVSHMPFLTVIRDADGDGKAEERKDLFKDLGPTNNQGLNDHIVSGIQFGMDGYLYISVGDKGIPKATGPDGRSIQIIGGGSCRCRPDGTGLEVVSTGTRNHLEVNLDAQDNLFSYDNTDDGLGWWTRVTHHIVDGYYGYPYDYHPRPDRHLPRMAEYGGGSPCGAVLYKEDAWPEQYQGVGFWAEWGKGKVHAFKFAPDGSTFKVAEAIDFAVPNGVDNFRPIDLAVSFDGRTLYIADWGMGGWGSKTEKVGRVYAVTYKGEIKSPPRGKDSDPIEEQIKQLNHPAFHERMRAQTALIHKGQEALKAVSTALLSPGTPQLARRHLVWTLERINAATPEGLVSLLTILRSHVGDLKPFTAVTRDGLSAVAVPIKVDFSPDVVAQAARALGERQFKDAAEPLISLLLKAPEPTVRLQAVIALGRIGDPKAIPALVSHLTEKDEFIAFSARQALRRIGDWKATAETLASDDPKTRAAVLATLELVYNPTAASTLAQYAKDTAKPASERARAVLYLGQVHRKVKPWDGKWWGTRPADGKPPAKVDAWEGTTLVLEAIRGRLADPAVPVRLEAVAAVKDMRDLDSLPALRSQYGSEKDPEVKVTLAKAFGELGDKDSVPVLIASVREHSSPDGVRDAALAAVEKIGDDLAIKSLVELLEQGNLGDHRQARVIAALGRFKSASSIPALVKQLQVQTPSVRAAAAEALGKIGRLEGVSGPLRALLTDPALDVKKSAITALGVLADRESLPALLAAANSDPTRFEAIKALSAMPDVLALQVYLQGLGDKSPDLRKVSAVAIEKIRNQAAPILDQLAERHELSSSLVPELRKIFTSLQPIMEWRLLGPFDFDAKLPFATEAPVDLNGSYSGRKGEPVVWKESKAVDSDGQVDLNRLYPNLDELAVLGYAEIPSLEERTADFAVGSDDTLTVWLNGKQVYDHQDRRSFEPAKDHFNVKLAKGTNRLLVKCGNHGGGWQFSVAVSTSKDYAFLKGTSEGGFDPEKFRQFALKGQGKAEHGRVLFEDLKGLACIKCHAVGTQGGKVGPELSSVGAKYPREELIASVLNPSARISSGYEPIIVATTDGRILTGIVKTDTEVLEIEDVDAKRIRIPKEEIEERKRSDVSLMPSGLAQGLSPQDFADLIAYLETLKDPGAKPAAEKP